MSLDVNTQAAKDFYKEIRKFSERVKPWQPAIFYDITVDEAWDATRISERVYGNRHEFLAVMAAAGVDSVDQELTQKRIALPTPAQLYAIKRKTGFESNPEYRDNYQPTWID